MLVRILIQGLKKETNDFIKIYRKKYPSTDPRYIHADDIIPGQAKDGPILERSKKSSFLRCRCT